MNQETSIDYLAIGHVCYDLVPEGKVIGGPAAYSSRTAQALGCQTAVLTSTASDYNLHTALPNIQIHSIPSANTTTFENVYTLQGRIQTVHAVASTLLTTHLPKSWNRARIVHLAPIANEVDPKFIHLCSNSLMGLSPQGWLRRWQEDGRVYAREWPVAQQILPLASAVILSTEDLLDDQMLTQYRQWSKLLVLTQGEKGCTVFMGDEMRHIPAPKVNAHELTGAGDVFAAAYLLRLYQTAGNPWEAARFANEIAAQSVTAVDLDAKIQRIKDIIKSL